MTRYDRRYLVKFIDRITGSRYVRAVSVFRHISAGDFVTCEWGDQCVARSFEREEAFGLAGYLRREGHDARVVSVRGTGR